MRAVLLASVLLAGCWSRDDFRSRCILAGNCQLDPEPVPVVDAGLELETWSEVTSFLFGGLDGGDSSFDVSFVRNLSADFRAPNSQECAYVAGVLTASGSVLCPPVDFPTALEVLPDGGTRGLSVSRTNGQWGGGVLLDNGKVFAAPTQGDEWLAVTEPVGSSSRGFDLIPLGPVRAPLTGLARTRDGEVVAPGRGVAAVYRSDGGSTSPTGQSASVDYAGALLLPSGKVLLVPRSASQAVEVSLVGNALDRVTPRGNVTGVAGGVLLESGEALLMPAAAGGTFVRVPVDGMPATFSTSTMPSRVALFSAAWSTNGYAYGLDVDGGSPQVVVIDRRGNVTWQQLPASALDAGLFGPLSHLGLTAMADGRLVSCGCRSSSAMILTPRTRRTLPIEVMSSPWLNKW